MLLRWKTPVSLTLLLVFTFNTCLFGVFLTCLLCLHKEQEKNSLNKPTKEIIELRISETLVEQRNAEFEWEKDWEFKYHGEMYDVVDSHKEGSTWIFACKHDTKEEILKNRAAREAKRNQQDRDTQSKKNLKVGSEYLANNNCDFIFNVSPMDAVANSSRDYSAVHREVPCPPPWLI